MSLKQRIQSTVPDTVNPSTPAPTTVREEPERIEQADPFSELKTRVHHDVITRLGPRLFTNQAGEAERDGELAERVKEAVEEAIALDKTPLTRQERGRITSEITDDILG